MRLYQQLKKIVNEISEETLYDAEGKFLSLLLNSIKSVDEFYARHEAEYANNLEALAKLLCDPKLWLIQSPQVDKTDMVEPDFAELVSFMEAGVHVPTAQREALDAFLVLCTEIDLLRKFSVRPTGPLAQSSRDPFILQLAPIVPFPPIARPQVLNALAVTKICKKHDKHSVVALSSPVLTFVHSQSFYTSRHLAATFTHAQCIASEILTAATESKPPSVDYTCVARRRAPPPHMLY